MTEWASSGASCYHCGAPAVGECRQHLTFYCPSHGDAQGCATCHAQWSQQHQAASSRERIARDARRMTGRLNWANFVLFLAILVAVPTALLIYFYETTQWRDEALRWAYREEQYGIAVRIAEGSWAGVTWQDWAWIGVLIVGGLLVVWAALRGSAQRQLKLRPELRDHINAARAERTEQALALIGCLLIIPLILIIISAAAAFAQDDGWGGGGGGGGDDDDEDDD